MAIVNLFNSTSETSYPRILCVDDREGNLLALQAIFSSTKCELVLKTSGEEALQYLNQNEVAVIILDVQMPGMDGFEVARRIRENPESEKTPILFLTALDLRPEYKKRAYELGAADFLHKPVDDVELSSKVNVFIELFQSRQTIKKHFENMEFLKVEGEMARRFREMDWSQNPLGPIENWDQSLKTAVGLMLRSAFPQFISWGPEKIFLYNDAYKPVLGTVKHPSAFGGRFQSIWAEIWPDLGPIVERVDRGEGSYHEDMPLLMNRNGFDEQTFFTFSYSPILDDSERIQGLYCSCVETTKRLQTENELQAQVERLDAIIGTMTEGVVFLDPSGQLTRMNQEALRLHGFETPDEMFTELSDFVKSLQLETLHGEPLAFENWPANRVLKGDRFSAYEVVLKDQRTGRKWIGSYGGSAIYDSDGNLTSGILTVRDVTGQKRTEMRLRESESQIKQNEQRLQQIIETIPQGVWRTDPDGSADYFSEKFYELVGYNPEEFLGWGWSQVIHPDDQERVLKEWQSCRGNQEPVAVDFRIRRKDGSYRWFLSLGNPFFDQDNNLVKYYGTWTDIHNQRLARAELQTKSDALENSLNGFDIINSEGQFIYANSAYLKMWGYDSLEEVLGTSPVHHCVDPKVPETIIRTLKETGECNIEFQARRKDGSTFDVNMWARLAYDSDGNEIYPTTSIDITERKQIENALRAAKEEAEKANELKSAFLANMSHEIRTPLGAMIGFADLLRDPELIHEERESYIDVLTRNGNQLSHVINDILDLSKVEAGHMKFEWKEVNPAKVANEVISLLKMNANEKELLLNLKLDESTPNQIITDPIRLKQVLINIVGNAIKFTPVGSVTLKVSGTSTDENKPGVAFEVEDTGIGIPSANQSELFQVFSQADVSMTRKYGGTGLGLALSRKLAQGLGGNVILSRSEESRGSTFLITVSSQFESHQIQKKDVFENFDFQEPEAQALALENIKVLVVEDSSDNQKLIWRILTKSGARVEMAENGLEGVNKALKGSHDLILMDLQMPLMDGYTATQKLRDQGYRKPIIALTAHAMNEVRRKCLNVGCNDHLTKPIHSGELIRAVLKYSGLH